MHTFQGIALCIQKQYKVKKNGNVMCTCPKNSREVSVQSY